MDYPEYLSLFANEGDYDVTVSFRDKCQVVAKRQTTASEFLQIVSEANGGFRDRMTFDEWPFEIYKYQIDLANRHITLYARRLEGETPTEQYPLTD
ncbi:hypothetical protein [Cupriavidus pauculus]|uniref:Uncharacterized protein n=1 Tax=Cupriavidus pauculus TaxID=82633 RepID=A0A3G8H191_9BURK|nr:hypothetical protein [Cupriavidus pauculus]AZG13242.1 hypothetical protein EHF44_07185 [Cupriavidus pauculus]